MEFLVVPTVALGQVWPRIREDWRRVEPYSDYDEPAVLLDLASGFIQLALGRQDQQYAGFFIFKLASNNLHIGALHSKVGLAAYEAIDDFARRAGVKRLSFNSPRPGWKRKAALVGFEPWAIMYKKEL